MSHDIQATLVHSTTSGGHNARSGSHNRFSQPTKKWGIEFNDPKVSRVTVHFKRKKDAVAALEVIQLSNWNGRSDLEMFVMSWQADCFQQLSMSSKAAFNSFKGLAS